MSRPSKKLGTVQGLGRSSVRLNGWVLDDDDFALITMLQDPIYAPELLWDDHSATEYGGCWRCRDYQWPLFRPESNYQGHATGRAVGKALAHGEPVATPGGWVGIEDLEVGDQVIGLDGQPCNVVGVFPQGVTDLYDVTFTDGTVVRCDGGHRWNFTASGARSGIYTTEEAARLVASGKRLALPPQGPAWAPVADLPLDPYLLGVLLGDGGLSQRTPYLTTDREIIGSLVLPPGVEARIAVRVTEDVVSVRLVGTGPQSAPNPLTEALERLGLMGSLSDNKSVPEAYMHASVEQRKSVLQGLLDTDGCLNIGGGPTGVKFTSTSPVLARQVKELAHSLGWRAGALRQKEDGYRAKDGRHVVCKDSYHLIISPDTQPFRLARKAKKWAPPRQPRQRSVRDITAADRGAATCISVDAADSQFLCRNYVATLNTESIKAKAFVHAFRRHGEDMLITAPELIHLLPLTDAIESRIRSTRLTRDFLDTRQGKTGTTHRPFGVDYLDRTKIVGRIPRLSGTGVKGQHAPDVIIDEAQDYSEAGWREIHEVTNKDKVDFDGEPDFHYEFYGVHSGARDSGFHKRVQDGAFKVVQITALQRPSWNSAEKEAAKAAYGGSSSPDYRRNILGEAGAASSSFFVISRLMACLDQNRESDYNQNVYRHIELRSEEFEEIGLPAAEVLDLPTGYRKVWAGMDLGLTNSPTVISIFAEVTDRKTPRLKLIRRITLERFRVRRIREVTYAIGAAYGNSLQGFGMDVTGLGFPIWQEMEDDEFRPARLAEVSRGYFFNAKVPVAVDRDFISDDGRGQIRDQYGASVKLEVDPLTGESRYVTYMTMLEASTRYLREWVDTSYLWLPFDTAITSDMMGETQQRVRRTGELRKKPNAFHLLDSFRAMAMAKRAGEIEYQLLEDHSEPVMDIAL